MYSRSVTLTTRVYCPVCRQPRLLSATEADALRSHGSCTYAELCCSPAHVASWRARICAAGRQHHLTTNTYVRSAVLTPRLAALLSRAEPASVAADALPRTCACGCGRACGVPDSEGRRGKWYHGHNRMGQGRYGNATNNQTG
jgi:hypothetical protein